MKVRVVEGSFPDRVIDRMRGSEWFRTRAVVDLYRNIKDIRFKIGMSNGCRYWDSTDAALALKRMAVRGILDRKKAPKGNVYLYKVKENLEVKVLPERTHHLWLTELDSLERFLGHNIFYYSPVLDVWRRPDDSILIEPELVALYEKLGFLKVVPNRYAPGIHIRVGNATISDFLIPPEAENELVSYQEEENGGS